MKKTILAALLLGSANAAHAVMILTVSYDSLSDSTTVDYTGSFDVFNLESTGSLFGSTINSDTFISGGSALFVEPALGLGNSFSVFAGDFGLMSLVSATSTSGDTFGFFGETLIAPVGYTAGSPLSGSTSFAGDLFDITANPIQTGVFSGGGNTVNWATAAVPEPGFGSIFAGVGALGVALSRRRRR